MMFWYAVIGLAFAIAWLLADLKYAEDNPVRAFGIFGLTILVWPWLLWKSAQVLLRGEKHADL